MTYREALYEVLQNVAALDTEEKLLLDSIGQVVAEDIRSPHRLPMVDMCGPDGYAVRAGDVEGADAEDPVILEIVGTVRAGRLPRRRIKRGEAMRVMTGSPLPDGADCVVPFEDTDEPGDKNGPGPGQPSHVKIFRAVTSRANVLPAGNNVSEASLLAPRGISIGPAQILALTAIGTTTLRVFRRPRVAIISTGDELIGPRTALTAGKSYDCNSAALKALVSHCGGTPWTLGIARDDQASLVAKICKGASADVIITSGGVSKGDYDLVRLVLGSMGKVVLSRILMGPGASFAFGLVDRERAENGSGTVPVLALSGPPIGCLINFETIARPVLRKMMGFGESEPLAVDAMADDPVEGKKPLAFVKWARITRVRGQQHVVLNSPKDLGPLATIANANCLAIIPPRTEVNRGELVEVLPLDWTRD